MALSGFVSKEDKASRLVMTARGFVVVVRRAPQDYEVFKDGVVLGRVVKAKAWHVRQQGEPELAVPLADSARPAHGSRQAALEWLVVNR